MKYNFPREKDRLELFFGKLTFSFHWPQISCKTGNYGIHANTQFLYRPQHNWEWDNAFVLRILGFGVSAAWNHCNNPNYVYKDGIEQKSL